MHYVDWLELLNAAVQSRFCNVFRIMNLETTWSYEDDRDSEGKMACIAIVYDMNESGTSDYEPLIKFIIPLGRDKLNEVYLAVVFERLSRELKECLEKAFENWSIAMAEYYRNLHGHFQEFLAEEDPGTPMDDPENYFLTHEVITLD